jgi:hypothetical protein
MHLLIIEDEPANSDLLISTIDKRLGPHSVFSGEKP